MINRSAKRQGEGSSGRSEERRKAAKGGGEGGQS